MITRTTVVTLKADNKEEYQAIKERVQAEAQGWEVTEMPLMLKIVAKVTQEVSAEG